MIINFRRDWSIILLKGMGIVFILMEMVLINPMKAKFTISLTLSTIKHLNSKIIYLNKECFYKSSFKIYIKHYLVILRHSVFKNTDSSECLCEYSGLFSTMYSTIIFLKCLWNIFYLCLFNHLFLCFMQFSNNNALNISLSKD